MAGDTPVQKASSPSPPTSPANQPSFVSVTPSPWSSDVGAAFSRSWRNTSAASPPWYTAIRPVGVLSSAVIQQSSAVARARLSRMIPIVASHSPSSTSASASLPRASLSSESSMNGHAVPTEPSGLTPMLSVSWRPRNRIPAISRAKPMTPMTTRMRTSLRQPLDPEDWTGAGFHEPGGVPPGAPGVPGAPGPGAAPQPGCAAVGWAGGGVAAAPHPGAAVGWVGGRVEAAPHPGAAVVSGAGGVLGTGGAAGTGAGEAGAGAACGAAG